MIYAQVFKTADRAQKRARFETQHCHERYVFEAVRFLDGAIGTAPFDIDSYQQPGRYTWRIKRISRLELARERDASRARYASVLYRARI